MTTATAIGLDPGLFASGLSGSLTPNAEAYVRPMIEKAAFVWSVNDAWAMLAAFALLGVLVVPFAWKTAKTRRLRGFDFGNPGERSVTFFVSRVDAVASHGGGFGGGDHMNGLGGARAGSGPVRAEEGE